MPTIEKMHHELSYEPTPTEVQKILTPYIGELAYALTDIIEKAKYLKWKSVIERKDFSSSDIFKGLNLPQLAKEALIVALEDILREHSLAYIGYPEKATMKNKMLRVLISPLVLPFRLFTSFRASLFNWISRIIPGREKDHSDESKAAQAKTPNEEDGT
jgi:hypothetical protein